MTDNTEQWLHRLGTDPLPMMELTSMQVRRLLKGKNTSYTDLSSAIKRDPGFSLAVLREINKTPSSGKDPIADIGRAIPLLGMSWLEETASKLPVITHKDPPDKRKAVFRCYSRALHASHYAQYLALQRNDHNPNELGSTALMNGIGEMALWINSYEMAQKIQSLMDDGIGQDEASILWLGLSISELSAALRSHWNLPNLYPQPNWPKGARPQREAGVGLACNISQASEFDWYSQTTQRLYQQAAEYLDTNVDQVEGSKIRQFKVEATKKNIFGLLMSKPKAFWMNPGNLVEYGHLIPEQATDSLGTHNFFAISLFSKTRPIGLMYADGGSGNVELDAIRYGKFKRLCQRITNQLK